MGCVPTSIIFWYCQRWGHRQSRSVVRTELKAGDLNQNQSPKSKPRSGATHEESERKTEGKSKLRIRLGLGERFNFGMDPQGNFDQTLAMNLPSPFVAGSEE